MLRDPQIADTVRSNSSYNYYMLDCVQISSYS
jgi:hypothetical protein